MAEEMAGVLEETQRSEPGIRRQRRLLDSRLKPGVRLHTAGQFVISEAGKSPDRADLEENDDRR